MLVDNHKLFESKIGTFLDSKNKQGLFGWFKVKDMEKFDDALFECKVELMPGKIHGAKEDGWYRISLGSSQDVLETALEKLHVYLINQ